MLSGRQDPARQSAESGWPLNAEIVPIEGGDLYASDIFQAADELLLSDAVAAQEYMQMIEQLIQSESTTTDNLTRSPATVFSLGLTGVEMDQIYGERTLLSGFQDGGDADIASNTRGLGTSAGAIPVQVKEEIVTPTHSAHSSPFGSPVELLGGLSLGCRSPLDAEPYQAALQGRNGAGNVFYQELGFGATLEQQQQLELQQLQQRREQQQAQERNQQRILYQQQLQQLQQQQSEEQLSPQLGHRELCEESPRSVSSTCSDSSGGDHLSTNEKKERRREQNRRAAKKCRNRKKNDFDRLQETCNAAKMQNGHYRTEISRLHQIIAQLRQEMERHQQHCLQPPRTEQ